MKKQMSIALGLAVLSTGAFASKARLQSLGESENGSYFVQDLRNVLYNPARALYHKDTLTLEWGNTANTDDSASSPRAEGGFLKAHNNMVYGLYFGNQADDGNGYKALTLTNINEGNTVSFLAAGDAGIQWGAGLTYGSFKNDGTFATLTTDIDGDSTTETLNSSAGEASLLRTRFGVLMGNMEYFAKINIMNKAESTLSGTASTAGAISLEREFKGKAGWQLGAIMNKGEMTYAGIISAIAGENPKQTTNPADHKYMSIEFQAGRTMQLNDRATMNYRIGFKRQTEEGAYLVTGSDQGLTSTQIGAGAFQSTTKEVEIMKIPMAVGVEIQAKDWLVLRGSINHNLWSSVDLDGSKSDLANSTEVSAGAGLIFGDLTVDGLIGNSTGTTRSDDTSASNGTIRTDELMSRVSMTYRF